MCETVSDKQITFACRTASLKVAKKNHTCCEHKGIIFEGETYWQVVIHNAGLAGIKFPQRVCVRCFWDFEARVILEENSRLNNLTAMLDSKCAGEWLSCLKAALKHGLGVADTQICSEGHYNCPECPLPARGQSLPLLAGNLPEEK